MTILSIEALARLGVLDKRRTIEGPEREQVLTMLRLIGPGDESNNQHLWCESWVVGDTIYNHYTGKDFDELEEVIKYDIQSHKETQS